MDRHLNVYVGWDPRETDAYAAAVRSFGALAMHPVIINPVVLHQQMAMGRYWRSHTRRGNILWDDISDAPMATEFAITRFLVPHMANPESQWALFVDCDVMAKRDVTEILDHADPRYAVMCVQHAQEPSEKTKMDGQIQTFYARKNWSSVMLFNLWHPANRRLTLDMVNELPGRDLHRFCWLNDDEIGALPAEWNWLAGVSDPEIKPAIVHYTLGIPRMPGYENSPYADEWRRWAGA